MLYSFPYGNPQKPLLFYKMNIFYKISDYKIMTLAQPVKREAEMSAEAEKCLICPRNCKLKE